MLRGETTVIISVPRLPLKPDSTKNKREKLKRSHATHSPIVEALRMLRRELADEENKPPFMIFSDMTLHEIVRLAPKSLSELLNVSGIGQHKASHYGKMILETLQLNRIQNNHELA